MTASERGRAVARWGTAAILLAITALHFVLVAALPVWLLGHAALDDALYLRNAGHLAAGEWLGPYDNRTLARGPFYPAFIALAHHAGVPIRFAQSALYLAAGALLLWAAQPWPGPRWVRVGTFALFAFEPMLYHTDLLRAVREGVYVPLTVLVLALCAASLRARDAALTRRLAWALALGGAMGAFWLTREEGPWILPALAVATLALIASRRGRADVRRAIARDATVLAFSASVAVACVQLVCWQNDRRYGTWTSVEFRQPAFERAYGALLRIDPVERIPYVPVTRAALSHAALESPATAEIAAVLMSGVKDGYLRFGCIALGVAPCDGQFRGGWFVFALRDAAAIAGHHTSAPEAQRFYAQLADEIDAACRARRLACSAPRRGLAPPLASGDLAAIAADALRGVARLALFTGFELAPAASTGRDVDLARYAALLHSRAFARGDPPNEFADPVDRLRALLLNAVADAYPWLVPPLALAASIALAWALRRGPSALATPWVALAAMLAVAIASRLAVVSAVASTSFPSFEPRYLSSAYPLLVVFSGLALGATLEATRNRRR
jgi:hypothetical protein